MKEYQVIVTRTQTRINVYTAQYRKKILFFFWSKWIDMNPRHIMNADTVFRLIENQKQYGK